MEITKRIEDVVNEITEEVEKINALTQEYSVGLKAKRGRSEALDCERISIESELDHRGRVLRVSFLLYEYIGDLEDMLSNMKRMRADILEVLQD